MVPPTLKSCLQGSKLKFVSWNCRGINSPLKRTKVFQHLLSLGAQVMFLQETHLLKSDMSKIKTNWIGQSYFASFSHKARGVAILFHKSVPFICTKVVADPNGRYLILTGSLYNTPLHLVNVYAPNWDNDDFFRQLFITIPDLSSHSLVLGGDLNCWLDPALDHSSNRPIPPSKSATVIKKFMEMFAITDPWRCLHPRTRAYSFYSSVHKVYTRIDYFLVDNRRIHTLSSCTYDTILISDHAPVITTLFFEEAVSSRPPWRLNTRLLSNETFISHISDHIDFFYKY